MLGSGIQNKICGHTSQIIMGIILIKCQYLLDTYCVPGTINHFPFIIISFNLLNDGIQRALSLSSFH